MLWPSAFKDARPLAFNPPDGDLPSERVQAPDMLSPMVKRGHLAPVYFNDRTTISRSFPSFHARPYDPWGPFREQPK